MKNNGDALVYQRVNEWCQTFGASRATAYRRIADGSLRTVRIGPRSIRIAVAASDLIRTGDERRRLPEFGTPKSGTRKSKSTTRGAK